MPVNRKHHAIDTAGRDRWRALGRLFRIRRVELGYRYRPAFAEAALPRTREGNLRVRALNAIENGERPGTYPPEALAEFARAYQVTEESIYAVLEGTADELTPADAAAARPLPSAPMEDEARESAVRPYAALLWERLLDLAGRGVRDPSGAQLGLDAADAKVWDGSAGAMSRADRAWLVADLQRRRAARHAAGNSGATSA